MDKEVRREIILDNYQHPHHKGLVNEEGFITKNTNNESCIDNIDLQMKVVDNKVIDAYFDGEACAICTSATSILVRNLIGKDYDEALKIIENYQNMINEKEYDKEILGELNVYDEVYMQPNRKKCALLPSEAAKKILTEVKK